MKFSDTLKVYKALADETRIRLIHILEYGDFHVNELLEILSMGQSRISRHLKILYQAGILSTRREGSFIYYSLRQDLGSFLEMTLKALRENSEKLTPDELSVQEHLQRRKRDKRVYFDDIAGHWDNLKKQHGLNDNYISKLSALVNHQKLVVELGSGTGSLLHSLMQPGGNYLGIDMSEEMVRIASQREVASDTKLRFQVGDIENIALPEKTCSTVFISMVLHHLVAPETTLKESYRILSPGGKLILHDLVKHNDDSYREIYQHRWLGFTEEDIQNWLEKNGFNKINYNRITDSNHRQMFICHATK